jgi:hypothetical protein
MARPPPLSGIFTQLPGGGGYIVRTKPMKMNQDQLKDFLLEFGAVKIVNYRDTTNEQMERLYKASGQVSPHPGLDLRKGISFHGEWDNGWVLSLQAGGVNYSEPKTYTEEYDSIEIAMWNSRHEISHKMTDLREVWRQYQEIVHPKYLVHHDMLQEVMDHYHSVGEFVDWKGIQAVVWVLASMRNPPCGNLERSSAPWRTE